LSTNSIYRKRIGIAFGSEISFWHFMRVETKQTFQTL